MSFVVTDRTVQAITELRKRGFLGQMHADATTDSLYQLVSNADGKVLATIDESAGNITYSFAQGEQNAG